MRLIALGLKSCIDIHRGVRGAMWRRKIASENRAVRGNHRVMTRRRYTFAINDQLFDQASIRVVFVKKFFGELIRKLF